MLLAKKDKHATCNLNMDCNQGEYFKVCYYFMAYTIFMAMMLTFAPPVFGVDRNFDLT